MESVENISYDIKQFVKYKNFPFGVLFTSAYKYLKSTVVEIHFDDKDYSLLLFDNNNLLFVKNYGREEIDMSEEFFEYKRKRKLNYILYGKSMEKCIS